MDLRFPEKKFAPPPVDMNVLNQELKLLYPNGWDTFLKHKRKVFEKNIAISPALQSLIHKYKDALFVIFDVFGRKVLNPKELEEYLHYFILREEEIEKNKQEVSDRVSHNPHATQEEYDLGVFREALETQVRDAVFALLKKGYAPVYSGFDMAHRHKEAVVLGADTVIVYKEHILGKPHTPEKAKEMLKMLSGKQHSAITGFTVIDTETDNTTSKTVETKVFFRDLTDKEIDDYIATGEPLNKAGSYAILEQGAKLVEKIEGSESNVAGLPMEEVMETLKEFDIVV